MTTLEAILSVIAALASLPSLPWAVKRIMAVVTKRGLAHIAAEEREHKARTDAEERRDKARLAELDRAIARAEKAEAARDAERDEHEEALEAQRTKCDAEKDMLRAQVAAMHEQLGVAALEIQRASITMAQVLRMRDDARDELAAGAKDVDVARKALRALLKTEEST